MAGINLFSSPATYPTLIGGGGRVCRQYPRKLTNQVVVRPEGDKFPGGLPNTLLTPRINTRGAGGGTPHTEADGAQQGDYHEHLLRGAGVGPLGDDGVEQDGQHGGGPRQARCCPPWRGAGAGESIPEACGKNRGKKCGKRWEKMRISISISPRMGVVDGGRRGGGIPHVNSGAVRVSLPTRNGQKCHFEHIWAKKSQKCKFLRRKAPGKKMPFGGFPHLRREGGESPHPPKFKLPAA